MVEIRVRTKGKNPVKNENKNQFLRDSFLLVSFLLMSFYYIFKRPAHLTKTSSLLSRYFNGMQKKKGLINPIPATTACTALPRILYNFSLLFESTKTGFL